MYSKGEMTESSLGEPLAVIILQLSTRDTDVAMSSHMGGLQKEESEQNYCLDRRRATGFFPPVGCGHRNFTIASISSFESWENSRGASPNATLASFTHIAYWTTSSMRMFTFQSHVGA